MSLNFFFQSQLKRLCENMDILFYIMSVHFEKYLHHFYAQQMHRDTQERINKVWLLVSCCEVK